MADYPILFSGEMIRALLDGRKTQTRRIVKPRRDPDFGCELSPCEIAAEINGDTRRISSPYGQLGDLLWVRETFYPVYPQDPGYNNGNPIEYDYRATYKDGDRLGDYWAPKKWTPSIHMPRQASRLTLELTNVRVELLQDISEEDAIAEGIPHSEMARGPYGIPGMSKVHFLGTAREAFEVLWNNINGDGAWSANPWVWALSFNVHKMNINQSPKREAA
jgi:hypothetical protein